MQVTLFALLGLFAQITPLEAVPPKPAEESRSPLAICTSLDADEWQTLGTRSRARRWVRPMLEALEAEAPLATPRPLRMTLDDEDAGEAPSLSVARSFRTTLD